MILFLYGDNSYLSWEKLEEIRARHQKANPDTSSQVVLEAKEASFEEIIRQIKTLPFLAKSRLIILKNLLSKGAKDLQEKILDNLSKVPPSTILVIYEDKSPDKRTKIFKDFKKKIQKSKEFSQLGDYQLRIWIKEQFGNFQKQIDLQALEKLIIFVGNDLWRLSNEIEKLILLADQKAVIDQKDVKILVRPKIDSNIFNLVDALSENNREKAMKELHKLYENGTYELVILSMIIRQFRNLLVIVELADLGYQNYKIEQATGLHPFVIKKTLIQTRNFNFGKLKQIYQIILAYDIKIKTGEIEAKLALEMLVAEICLQNQISKIKDQKYLSADRQANVKI